MNITIYGCGYVGLVTGTCFAEMGHHVLCIDTDSQKVDDLKRGIVSIYEPKLTELIKKNCNAGKLNFSTNAAAGVEHSHYQFIAVNTPTQSDGSADITRVVTVAETIAQAMTDYQLIINKSTVPVGTGIMVQERIAKTLAKRGLTIDFDVASNPEFLKEGAAIDDFMRPDRIILGAETTRALSKLHQLYDAFKKQQTPIIDMGIRSAELTKYAANALLATKISFINEMAAIAEQVGADIEQVRLGMSFDPRIGPHFISPGCGYGGSCFPKDVKALIHTATQVGIQSKILPAVEEVNTKQKHVLYEKIKKHFKDDLQNRTIALWGLSFKPHTNDMREASSRTLLEALWSQGVRVQAYDPVAMPETLKLYGERSDLILCKSPFDCLKKADALAIVTEWPEFRNIDPLLLQKHLTNPIIFDGRNIYDPAQLKELGITYYGIGRPVSSTK